MLADNNKYYILLEISRQAYKRIITILHLASIKYYQCHQC